LIDQARVGDCGGAENDATNASSECTIDVLHAAKASTNLKRNTDVTSKCGVEIALLRVSFESSIEVDDMDADGTSIDKLLRDLQRGVRECCLAIEIALIETYNLAFPEVDSGNYFHLLTRG
jgi:hypothetical protein